MTKHPIPGGKLSNGTPIDTSAYLEGVTASKFKKKTGETLESPYRLDHPELHESYMIGFNLQEGQNK